MSQQQTMQLRLKPQQAYEPSLLHQTVARELHVDPSRLKRVDIVRRSIDARQRQVIINLEVVAHIDEIDESATNFVPIAYNKLPDDAPNAIVVGAGPAGLFAALRLIELGIRPIVLERGKDVDSRKRDLARISRENIIDPDSNYCFGEGGAGAYSDGKLYTRSKKRGSVEKILRIFHQHGASHDILVDAHPHIGTDRLPAVIRAMRENIIACGGEVHFSTKVTSLILDKDATQCSGVVCNDDKKCYGPVILATGHSARDIYRMLDKSHVQLQIKGIAVGARLEHPQHLVDCIMYHSPEGRGKYLPAAEYSMLTRIDNRAVYSFCMCPGGFIIPAATEDGQLVVNGMSPSNRGTQWSNSGMVVEILPEDLPEKYAAFGNLAMMHFQDDIEQRFFQDSNGTQNAPAQRMDDFVNARNSKSLPRTSYAPGIHPSRIDQLLPPEISSRLRKGFAEFGRKYRGFLTNEALVIGCETRTSSPVRIPRDSSSLSHIQVSGLFPCGEGAGYAGGIVSAAIDGERSADAVAAYLNASGDDYTASNLVPPIAPDVNDL